MKIFNEKTIQSMLGKSTVLKQGYLYKRGDRFNHDFKKRFFMLTNTNIMCYYTHHTDKDPIGVIFLEGHRVELGDDLDSGRPTLLLTFPGTDGKDAFSSRTYCLAAESMDDIKAWMSALMNTGSESVLATLEEMEDQVEALNVVATLEKQKPVSGVSNMARCRDMIQRYNPFDQQHDPCISMIPESKSYHHHQPQQKTQSKGFEWTYESQEAFAILCAEFDNLHSMVNSYWLSKQKLCSNERSLLSTVDGQKTDTSCPTGDLISFD